MIIYCSGIGGIGLSAYAAYQKAAGHDVYGSDLNDSDLIKDLKSQGIKVSLTQDGVAVPEDCDLFVYTLALPDDHPELMRARELKIPERTYFQALGELMKPSKTSIAIAGTHGKSSTTAMLAKVVVDAGLDPSIILGTKTPDLENRNWRRGSGDIFIAEACEYRRSFLNLSPKIVLLTNVTGDHFDAFKDEEDYKNAFREFLKKIPVDGTLITHLSDSSCADMAEECECNVIDADQQPFINLSVPGVHMQENAKLVLALASVLGISDDKAQVSLKEYKGCWRRSEIKGKTAEGALVIDDYGHHPNEIKVTLSGLKEAYPDRRLICVFQPHTHDRTVKFYDEFTKAFSSADLVIIPNIFAARSDRDSEKVDPGKLVCDIKQESSVEVLYGESLEGTVGMLKNGLIRKNDLVVTMGAGDVWKISEGVL